MSDTIRPDEPILALALYLIANSEEDSSGVQLVGYKSKIAKDLQGLWGLSLSDITTIESVHQEYLKALEDVLDVSTK